MKSRCLLTLLVLGLMSSAAWAQDTSPQPMTAAEAMLGRCVAEGAVVREKTQKALADAKTELVKAQARIAELEKGVKPAAEAKPTEPPAAQAPASPTPAAPAPPRGPREPNQ